jgi:two-component system phosphate regulon sensor histidine kinase PhoR
VQKKIFMYIMTVLIITSIISVYFTVQTIQDEQISGVEKKLLSEAYILSQMVAQKMQIDDIKSLNYLLADISKNLQVRITIIDNLGKVLTETSYDPTMMGSHLERPEVQKALMGETGTEIRFSETMKINFMYVTHPIYIDNSIAGIVRISSPMKEIQGIMRGLNSHLFIALIPGLILSLLLVYRISVSITRPIKDIKNAAVDITHGKLDTELSVISRDEIGELAKAIDFMAVSLKEKINHTF